MSLITNIKSQYNTKQYELIESYLQGKSKNENILWKSVFNSEFNNKIKQLTYPISFNKIISQSVISYNTIQDQIDLINLNMSALAYEHYNLKSILNKQELYRKDDVQTLTNIKKDNINILTNDIEDYIENKIDTDNGYIEMKPTVITEFPIHDITTTFYPEEYEDKTGNIPDSLNITSNDYEYWLTEIITKNETTCGAVLEIDFNQSIKFNLLFLNFACKYIPNFTKIEVYEKLNNSTEFDFVEKDFKVRKNNKLLEVYFEDEDTNEHLTYTTNKIRITIEQDKYDYLWEKVISKEDEILNKEIISNDSIRLLLYSNTYSLYNNYTTNNVYSYIFGLFFIKAIYKNYNMKEKISLYKEINPNDIYASGYYTQFPFNYSVGGEHLKVYITPSGISKDSVYFNTESQLITQGYTEYSDDIVLFQPEDSVVDISAEPEIAGELKYYSPETTPSGLVFSRYDNIDGVDVLKYHFIDDSYKIVCKINKDSNPSVFTSSVINTEGKKIFKINTEEHKVSPFTIDYIILDKNGSVISTKDKIRPNVYNEMTTLYNTTDIEIDVKTNYIVLSHYPYINDNLECYLDGVRVEIVDVFSGDNLQGIINKNILYINKDIESGQTLSINYDYYPDNIYIKIELRTNSDFVITDCPKVYSIKTEFK